MKVVPVGEFAAGVELTCDAVLGAALLAADAVSLTLHGLRVSPCPGKHSKVKVAAAIRELGSVTVEKLLVTKLWLAASPRGQLVAVMRLDDRLRSLLATSKAFSHPLGKWQDLALFRNEKVLLWSCTHEGDAVIYGNRDWLVSQGLVPRRAEAITVKTESIDEASIDEIRKLVQHSALASTVSDWSK